MSPELKEAFVELYGNWEFWSSVLPVAAVALITWTFVFIYALLEQLKDFRNS